MGTQVSDGRVVIRAQRSVPLAHDRVRCSIAKAPGGCVMPIPIAIAPFNKKVTNRLTAPFAGHLPGFAIVMHRGRTSGRMYRTPVNAFRRNDDYVFVMTYGPDVDWVRNVEAAGECDIETRGRLVHLVQPRRFSDPARGAVPGPVGMILRLIDVDEFMAMHAS
jgi:deazaflavin-dependent oxidoreductase (nitroreductase family)